MSSLTIHSPELGIDIEYWVSNSGGYLYADFPDAEIFGVRCCRDADPRGSMIPIRSAIEFESEARAWHAAHVARCLSTAAKRAAVAEWIDLRRAA